MKAIFVLPTKNESNTILSVIEDIRSVCQTSGIEIVKIILTDDSTDKTRSIGAKAGAEIVVGGGKGLGNAMIRGLKKAIEYEADYVYSIDADGQVDLNEIKTFHQHAVKSGADMVLGSRFLSPGLVDYSYPLINRFGTLVLSKILRVLTKLPLTDSHGGIRIMKPAVIENFEIIGTHTYVQETIIDACENGFMIDEIPSRWLKREDGKSRVVLSISKYVFYTLPVLLLRAGSHIKYLFSLGIILIGLAFADIAIVGIDTGFSLRAMFDRQSFHLFFLLLSTGLNLFFFGVVLELLANLKRKAN